jgi:hypothetical protein
MTTNDDIDRALLPALACREDRKRGEHALETLRCKENDAIERLQDVLRAHREVATPTYAKGAPASAQCRLLVRRRFYPPYDLARRRSRPRYSRAISALKSSMVVSYRSAKRTSSRNAAGRRPTVTGRRAAYLWYRPRKRRQVQSEP